MKIDEQEKNILYKAKFKHVDKLLEKEFKDENHLGMCYKIWARKKQLLKQLYNIDWKSPAELNPEINFD